MYRDCNAELLVIEIEDKGREKSTNNNNNTKKRDGDGDKEQGSQRKNCFSKNNQGNNNKREATIVEAKNIAQLMGTSAIVMDDDAVSSSFSVN